MRISSEKTPLGVIVYLTLDDEDLKMLERRDPKGRPYFLSANPPQPVMVQNIIITKLKQKEIVQVQKIETELKDAMKDAFTIRGGKLSPCCEARMVHDDMDPKETLTCTKCAMKHKTGGKKVVNN